MRFVSYFYCSLLSLLLLVYYSYSTQKQFYPTIMFLVTSKFSLVIAGNSFVAILLMFAYLFKIIYFGNLREVETELLIEKAKYTITETCLALTIFRSELSPPIIVLFGSLILVKLIHKLSKSRIEYLEQIMPVAVSTQVRVGFLLLSLILIDSYGAYTAVQHIMKSGRSVLILFGFEFGLLVIYSFNLSVRFLLQVIDSNMANGLTSRGFYTMLVDLICEIIKFVTYIAFFSLIFLYYGIPLHIMRDVWSAFTSFHRKLTSFIKYLKLTRNLDKRFEDATVEELATAGNCLVCREEMDKGKKLPCGHIFHLDCLRSWLQHQQSCPLCRADIPATAIHIHPPNNNNNNANPAAAAAEQRATHPYLVPNHSSATANILNSLLTSHSPFVKNSLNNQNTGNLTFPTFFLVIVKSAPIFAEPLFGSREIRSVEQGTILFISFQAVIHDDMHWLKTPDGWVLQKLIEGSEEFHFLVQFNHNANNNKQEIVEETVSETKSPVTQDNNNNNEPMKVYSRQHFLSKFNSAKIETSMETLLSQQKDIIQQTISLKSPNNNKSYDEDRIRNMITIQTQIAEVTKNLSAISKSVLTCQECLAHLLEDEVKKKNEIEASEINK